MRRILLRTAILLTSGVLLVAGTYVTMKLFTSTPLAEGCTVEVDGIETKLEVSQAENASLIAAVAVRQDYPPRAATVALATAYQESGLRNLDHGDRDSLGLFQQRPSQGWGSRAQISDPYYSTQTFYDHLMDVEGYREMSVTEAAQRVQRSADGSAYAQHEADAEALTRALTGRDQASFSCRLAAVPTPSPYAAAAGQQPADDPAGTNDADGTGGTGGGSTAQSDGSTAGQEPSDRSDQRGQHHQGTGRDGSEPPGSEHPQPSRPLLDPERGTGAPGDEPYAPAGPRPLTPAPEADAPDGAPNPDDSDASVPNQPANQSPDPASDEVGQPSRTTEPEPRSAAEAVQRELAQAFGSAASEQTRSDLADGEADRDTGGENETGGSGSEEKQPAGPVTGPESGLRDNFGSQDGSGEGVGPASRDGEAGTTASAAPNAPATDVEVDGDRVLVRVDDQEVGWAIAHWAVANTQRLGITEVGYDERSWTARESVDGWVADEKSADRGAVRIGLD